MANQGQQSRIPGQTAPAMMYGRMLPAWVATRAKDFFVWSVDWEGATPLAAGGTASRSFLVDRDADALIVAVTGVIFDAGAVTAPTTNPLKLAVNDTGSGRNLQNVAFMWDALVGTGALPGYLPYPKLIPAASTVQVQAQNLDGANAFDVHVSFMGFKVFQFSEQ